MDDFGEQSVEFLNCMTTPSTLMSLSASLTGLPAYFLAQNYKDFQFNTDYFETFNSVLKEEGYETNKGAVIMHPEVRVKLKQFDILPKRFWPSGYSHIHWFNNQMVLEMVKSALDNPEIINSRKPNFGL